MENTVYDSFVDAYNKANGDVDTIDMTALPDEIQKMFSDDNYDKQIELFDYCSKSTKLEKELQTKAADYSENLSDLQVILASDGNFEQDKKFSDVRDKYVQAPHKKDLDRALTETQLFLEKKYEQLTDQDAKEKIGKCLAFFKTFPYEAFVDAYKKASGNIDKIDMSKMPSEIQTMFSDNDYDKQIELFDYCSKSTKLEKELQSKAARYSNNLSDLQDIFASDGKFEQNDDFSSIRDGYVDDPRQHDNWLAEYKLFFEKKYTQENTPEAKEKIGKYIEFLKTFTAEAFVNAYKKASGNIDKIDMSKMPSEIQTMFSDNDYKGQIALFEYCNKSDKLKDAKSNDKLQRKAKIYTNNLRALQKVITSQNVLKKQIERDQIWFKEDPQKRESWRKGLEAFFKERHEKETDPVRQKRIASYLDFLADPVNFDVNTIENDSKPDNSNEPVIFSNSENAGPSGNNDNPQGEDFEEPDNDKIPAQVKKLKEAFSANGIAIRATKEGQEDYPFSYNLYEKGKTPGEGVKPTGKLEVVQEDKVVLDSKDVRHFVAAMNGLRKSGKDEIKLELKGDNEDAKKAFAANAIVAGMITGVKVTDCPYQLEDLKAINPLIEKVMELKSKQDAISKTAEKVENGETQQEAALETQITEAFESYKQISKDLLPPKEQLHIFECGAKAVEKTKTRSIALKVAQSMKGNQH